MSIRKTHRPSGAAILSMAAGAFGATAFSFNAAAAITHVQTVDGWFTNTYAWGPQGEPISLKRNFDPVGTVVTVCARVVQEDGSQVGTPPFVTTMTKTAAGLVDTWTVAVPAGTITDGDWWDATTLIVELVACPAGTKKLPGTSGFGPTKIVDRSSRSDALDPTRRYLEIDGTTWNHGMVMGTGFDFTLVAYASAAGPIPLVDLDPLGLTTLHYTAGDTFGTGQAMDYSRFRFLLIDLDPTWNVMPTISNGLNNVQFDLPAGKMFTDQGVFNILRVQPVPVNFQQVCPADYNNDGTLDVLDFLDFFDDFGSMNPAADFNLDGLIDVLDFLDFLDAFGAGCP